ncbi:hypothetical protein F5X71_21180 [Nocardia brasiliensis]|uniref:Uncharacterized protein n=1 Tax=Nocardia brasiliensis TaxID=37326 RepID=A0A6G9XUI2_NOCBR|nr:hypothetical protein [Nocardia brasiliensis]QIS04510.1 hypothetical protein F5X71_21180 [Nocardia brasiliensis]
MTTAHRPAAGRLAFLYRHRPLLLLAAAMALLTVFGIGALIVDDRVLTGLPIWAKAVKFALSTLIYAVTWAWLIDQLTAWRRVAWWAGAVVAVGLGIELIIIVIQIVRGTTSHFNYTTPLNGALWNAMGSTIVAVWLATVLAAAALFRSPARDRARDFAIRSGAVLSVLGAALGMLMTMPSKAQLDSGGTIRGAHTVGLADGGPGLPLLGWSTVGGDLRIPHFLGMHALQVIPLVLLAVERAARRFPALRATSARRGVMVVMSVAYAAVLAVLTWQALRGQSVVHPDALTLLAFGVIALAATTSIVSVLRGAAPRKPAAPAVATTGGVR